MKLVQLTTLLLTAGILAQPASAGPFDALKNFFVRPQQRSHEIHHPRPVHPKEAKEAPSDSPAPVVSPADQQPNTGPAQNVPNSGPAQNVPTTTNRPNRPATIVAAPLY
jgi:hypothetical protein